MPRFVLLYHECPPNYDRPSHWDLMFETSEALRTWALPQLPSAWHEAYAVTIALHAICPLLSHENEVPAEKLADHRLAYLDYAGPVGGESGHVTRIDSGIFTTQVESTDQLDAMLAGKLLRGKVSLNRTSPSAPFWQLTWLA